MYVWNINKLFPFDVSQIRLTFVRRPAEYKQIIHKRTAQQISQKKRVDVPVRYVCNNLFWNYEFTK